MLNKMDNSKDSIESCISDTLVLATVLFRHGDRIPDIQSVLPTNPFSKNFTNDLFFPYKLGELTHKGQARMINVGSKLRHRYGSLLGDEFYTDMVSSTTSSYTRCQMSLQCVHAGLFPPSATIFSETPLPLKWQAVPFSIIPFEKDKFISFHMHCPQAMQNIDPEEIPNEDRCILQYISEQAGYKSAEYIHAMRIHDFFKTSAEAGIEIPEWVLPVWPTDLRSLASKFWFHFQNKRRRFGAGPLIKRITDEAKLKIAEGECRCGRKMYLYAVHDMNLHVLRGALNIWSSEPVEYGAYLIFELHYIDHVYGFKIFFQNGYAEPKLLTIPGQDDFIPLDEFEKITSDLYEPEPEC